MRSRRSALTSACEVDILRYRTRSVYPPVAATLFTFDEHGVCSGSRVAALKKEIDLDERGRTLTLRETDIRPDHLMDEEAATRMNDMRRLLGRRDEFVSVACPACGARVGRPVFTKHELTYVACGDCETLYVDPRPSPTVLADFYANSENYRYWNTYIFPASEAARRDKIFRPRAERLLDICRRNGVHTDALLEVGAGFGTFCEEIIRLGAFRRVVGVEPTPDLAATCRRRGIEVIEAPIEDVTLTESFDVVASFEVIEHLFAPVDFVRRCSDLLRPGGLFVLSTPNVKGFEISTLGPLSGSVETQHLNYFHPTSLSRLVEAHGLLVLEVQTPGKLDAELVHKKALAGEVDLGGQPFLRRVLLDEWQRLGGPFQQFLAEHGLSSHMWLVGKRQ